MTAALTTSSPIDSLPSLSPWRYAIGRIISRPLTLTCLCIVAMYVIVGLLSFTPHFQVKIDEVVGTNYESPTLKHVDLWLGADIQGRSVLWRLLYGTRIALTITVCATVFMSVIGVVMGVMSGYFGGWIDVLITWLFTTVSSIPWVLLVLALVYTLKERTVFGYAPSELAVIIFALGVTDWVGLCRLIRGEVLKHRDREYVQAARAAGLSTPRILVAHILPNVMHLVIVTATLSAVGYLQAEVVLAFLGLGISGQPSWGRMIDDAKVEMLKGVWWQVVAATAAIGILCLALSILGDALRDALDPRLRGVD